MPHVIGLEILNDCEENQKLILKIPDWLVSRWNRQVTVALMEGKEFSNFVSLEAEIACNPVNSLHALHSSKISHERKGAKEFKGNKVNVFSTQTAVPDKLMTSNEKSKPPAQQTSTLYFIDRRRHVKEKRLCFQCLKPGHNPKECCYHHTCDVCKGRHPTCLHDENYKTCEGQGGDGEHNFKHSR